MILLYIVKTISENQFNLLDDCEFRKEKKLEFQKMTAVYKESFLSSANLLNISAISLDPGGRAAKIEKETVFFCPVWGKAAVM